jgi:4-amino-4-deoxy-L-arabinose transferase-like glycosyltransferase
VGSRWWNIWINTVVVIRSNRIWRLRLFTLALLLYFWWGGVAHLDRFPTVHEDEPWIAAPGYTLWEEGHFGTELFAGFYGMEQHYYQIPPLFSLLLGGGLHVFGLGLFQARVIPLMCILLTLALTYRLGATLFSGWHGVLAVAVLVGWSIAQPAPRLVSGVPMADVARIARYDAGVPPFALGALVMLVRAINQPSRLKFVAIGALTGLAALSHLYGGFWLAAIIVVIVLRFRRRAVEYTGLAVIGFGLVLLPWLLFVASNAEDFINQNRLYAGRFRLSDPQFYIENLSQEWQRYQPVTEALRNTWGAQLWLVTLVIGVVWLLWRVRKKDQSAGTLLILPGVMIALFALLLKFKTFTYLATLWPLFALVVACGWVGLWGAANRRLWRIGIAALFCSAMVIGGLRTLRVHQFAQGTTPYRTLTEQIAALLPPDTRLLALQHYWFGLADRTRHYRSLLVPIFKTNPLYVADPIPFAQAVDEIPATVLLLDQPIQDLLADTYDLDSPENSLGMQILDYLNSHNAKLLGVIDDPSYGKFYVYQI